ncbi:MAG: DUF3025 domain-containing protein [Thiobacillaceae bacterium]
MDFSHPAFVPYRRLLARLPQNRLASPAELTRLARKTGRTLRFVETNYSLSACDYEQGILESGAIPTRPDNLHDFMNALVWLTFPQAKANLNRLHCRALADNPVEAKYRSPQRDALTLLDESGVLVFTQDEEFLPLLATRRWHELFIHRRERLVNDSDFLLLGHAVMEKLIKPRLSITSKCLVISARPASLADADRLAATALADVSTPKQLPPLPVAGIPGWHPHNHLPAFFDSPSIFRPLAHCTGNP